MADPTDSSMPGTLGAAALGALLERLRAHGPSPEVSYEQLRRRLIAFFRLQLPAQAEALTDTALDRLARRIHEGTAVENVFLYALGIGRMLVRESRSKLERERTAAKDAALWLQITADDGQVTAALAALRDCLATLGSSAAELILAYYSADGAARIARRQAQAESLGLSLNALRNRALRLRSMLERCAREKLVTGDANSADDAGDA